MTREELMKRLMVGVDADGCIDSAIETTVGIPMPIEMPGQAEFRYDPDDRFVAFEVDNGPTNIEVRIPFEIVEWLAEKVREVAAIAAKGMK